MPLESQAGTVARYAVLGVRSPCLRSPMLMSANTVGYNATYLGGEDMHEETVALIAASQLRTNAVYRHSHSLGRQSHQRACPMYPIVSSHRLFFPQTLEPGTCLSIST